MTTIQTEIHIARPPEVVFSWLVDLARHRQFLPDGWSAYKVTTPVSSGKGARATWRMRWYRNSEPVEVEITEAENPSRLVQRSTAGDFMLSWSISKTGGSSQVVLSGEYLPSNGFLNRLLTPFVTTARLRADCQQAVERLKALCEGSER